MSRGGAVTPARRAAFEVLRRTFEHGAWTDRAFPAAARRHGVDGRERAQAQRMAYGAVQRRGTTDALIARLAGRPADDLDAPLAAALRLGLFELLFSAAPDHAAVDSAVELARGGMGGGKRRAGAAAGLVNAVLRRAGRELRELTRELEDDADPAAAAHAHSVPLWLARMWWEELGPAEARGLLRAVNEPLETALRVNTLRADPAALRSRLVAAGEPVGSAPPLAGVELPEGLVWAGPLGEAARAALGDGELFAQGRGSQAVVAILDPRPGERVLDLCAGPGVKTTAIAARMAGAGALLAVERDPSRAAQVTELCERAGAAGAGVEVGDAAQFESASPFDRVLVDPPCSDLGTLASRPDARWRKDPAAIERLAAEQRRILAAGARALAPGGVLVYSTCTISRRENHDVVAERPAGLEVDRVVETRPDRDGTDGFFIARLRRSGAGLAGSSPR